MQVFGQWPGDFKRLIEAAAALATRVQGYRDEAIRWRAVAYALRQQRREQVCVMQCPAEFELLYQGIHGRCVLKQGQGAIQTGFVRLAMTTRQAGRGQG